MLLKVLLPIKSVLFCGFLIVLFACQTENSDFVMLTPIPTPSFLSWIFPEPGSTISLLEFESGYPMPSSEMLPNAICIQLKGSELIEQEDIYLDLNNYIERSTLVVNEKVWVGSDAIPVVDFLGSFQEIKRNPKTGEVNIISNIAIGPFVICWQVPLKIGVHHINYQVQQTSGNFLSHTWQFSIVK